MLQINTVLQLTSQTMRAHLSNIYDIALDGA